MLSIERCRELLKDYSVSDEKILATRDYLYALVKEITEKNISAYESALKTTYKKFEKQTYDKQNPVIKKRQRKASKEN